MSFYRLQALPAYTTDRSRKDVPIWSGSDPVPAIGEEVHVRINRIGRSKVMGYGVEDGYLGVMVVPLDPPEWWVKQNGKPSPDKPSLAFGAEVRPLSKQA